MKTIYYNQPETSYVGPLLAVAAVLAFLALGGSFFFSILSYLDRPEVHISYETKECMEVVDKAAAEKGLTSEWSCTNLPPKYERVWVY